MGDPIISLGTFRDQFAQENLERLSEFEPPPRPVTEGDGILVGVPDNQLFLGGDRCSIVLDTLIKWASENKDTINAAMKAQVYGGKNPILWTNALVPFLESTAMYLRDVHLFHKAWRKIFEWRKAGGKDTKQFNEILKTHEEAYEDIRKFARAMDMEYVHVCDLVSEHPEGKPLWDGPFCGAFVPKNRKDTPRFIGLAFKGTNPARVREDLVDYNYQLIESSDALGNKQVSEGVYTGLFGRFKVLEGSSFEYIFKKLGDLLLYWGLEPTTSPRVHVTGHSLGGSYSQLCYAGLLPRMAKEIPDRTIMGDQYTFGAPRIGSQDWARYNAALLKDIKDVGQTWRIVHDADIVPQVPPTVLKPDQVNFRHVGNGVRIFGGKVPEDIPDETDGPDPPKYDIKSFEDLVEAVLESKDHVPNFYYNALVYAIKNAKS